MKVSLTANFPLTDDACLTSTGKSMTYWIDFLEANPDFAAKRRDAIQELYDQMGRGPNNWWATTIYVEFERKNGIVKKDGLLEGYNICVTKTIKAPIEAVYQAFKERTTEKWFGKFEPAIGEFAQDESGNLANLTRDRENKDLRFIWKTAGVENQTALDISFSNKAGKTELLVNHARIQTREEADGLRNAWAEAFDKLKSLLEA